MKTIKDVWVGVLITAITGFFIWQEILNPNSYRDIIIMFYMTLLGYAGFKLDEKAKQKNNELKTENLVQKEQIKHQNEILNTPIEEIDNSEEDKLLQITRDLKKTLDTLK